MLPIQTLVTFLVGFTKYCLPVVASVAESNIVLYQICTVGLALKTFKRAHEAIAMVIFCCNYTSGANSAPDAITEGNRNTSKCNIQC